MIVTFGRRSGCVAHLAGGVGDRVEEGAGRAGVLSRGGCERSDIKMTSVLPPRQRAPRRRGTLLGGEEGLRQVLLPVLGLDRAHHRSHRRLARDFDRAPLGRDGTHRVVLHVGVEHAGRNESSRLPRRAPALLHHLMACTTSERVLCVSPHITHETHDTQHMNARTSICGR